jgi:hypothetical protein
MGDRGLPYIGKYGPKPGHHMQFNIYRLLVERGYPVGHKDDYVPVKIKKIRAYYMTMMQVAGTGSTMTEDTLYMVSAPKPSDTEIGRTVLNNRDDVVMKRGKRKGSNDPEDYELSHNTKYRLTYQVPDIELMDLDKVMEFVVEKATILFLAFDEGIMPGLPSEDLMLWKCDSFCPVRAYCDEICKERGEVRAKKETELVTIPIEGE